MTTLRAVAVWVVSIVLSIIVGWEFFKTIFEIRETVLRYCEYRRLSTEPVEPTPINQGR